MSCTMITKMTRKSHQILRTGKDWTSSKTNFPSLGMLGPPAVLQRPRHCCPIRAFVPQMWQHCRQGHRVEPEGSWLSNQGTGLMFQSHQLTHHLGICPSSAFTSPYKSMYFRVGDVSPSLSRGWSCLAPSPVSSETGSYNLLLHLALFDFQHPCGAGTTRFPREGCRWMVRWITRPHTATVAELGSQPMGSQLQATSPSRTLKNAT